MKYPVIKFHQYGSELEDDLLYVFAASAKDLAAYCGIPKKGWLIRMLFQRWITESRKEQLKIFWQRASNPDENNNERYLLAPTSIVIALQDEINLVDNQINLDYTDILEGIEEPSEMLKLLSEVVLNKMEKRLNEDELEIINNYRSDPYTELPHINNNYIFEFCFQCMQMMEDSERFINDNNIVEDQLYDLIEAMAAISKPALVIDGQHRLFGAGNISNEVMLPVVAMNNCNWKEMIYQFVVINDKAEKINSEILNDTR